MDKQILSGGDAAVGMLLSLLKRATRPSIAYVLQYIVPSTKMGYEKLMEFYNKTKYAKNMIPRFFREEKPIPMRDHRLIKLDIMICKRSNEKSKIQTHPYSMSIVVCDKAVYEIFYVPQDSYPEKADVLGSDECILADDIFHVRAHVNTVDFDKRAIVRREPKLFIDPLNMWFEEYINIPVPKECLKVDQVLLELLVLASYDALPSSSWFKMSIDGWPMAVSRRFGFPSQTAKLFRLRRRLIARCIERLLPRSIKGLWPYSVIEARSNEQFMVFIEEYDKNLPTVLSHYPITPAIFCARRERVAYFSAVRTSKGELSELLSRLSRAGVIGDYSFEKVVKGRRFIVPWEMYNPIRRKWFWASNLELLEKYHVAGLVAWLRSGLLEFWRELQQGSPLARHVWHVVEETLREKGVDESFISEYI